MSFNGSGTFNINTTGNPIVTNTLISSTWANALTADLATGLSTCITKDGQTTTTARILFALGINSTLATDTTSIGTGSILTAGGASIAKALWVGGLLNVAGGITFQGALSVTDTTNSTSIGTGSINTLGGVGVTKALWVGGLANIAGVATFQVQPILSSLTASKPVFTDSSKGLVSTGTLGADQGGTGAATLTANNVLLGNGTSAVQFVAPGTSGNLLTSNGTTWASATPNGLGSFPTPGGRLTTESGVPISTADRTAQGTLYYTPYLSNQVWTYDSSTWTYHAFSEQSLALTVTSGKNYDVFEVAGTSIELSAAWTNDTTRADALARQNGVWVKSSDHSRLWLGTIRASGTNVTADSIGGSTTQVGGQGYVCNYYNAVSRPLNVIDTTANWNYTTATIRAADAAAGNKVEAVFCDAGQQATAQIIASISLAGNTGSLGASVGVGIDSTTAYSGVRSVGFCPDTTFGVFMELHGQYSGCPGLGYHYFSWNECGSAGSSSIFLGHNDKDQAGLTVFTFR